MCGLVHLATVGPRARRWDGKRPGAVAWRSWLYLWSSWSFTLGQWQSAFGKQLNAIFLLNCFRICLDLGIPVALENPYTSRLWLAPPMKHLLQHKLTDFLLTLTFAKTARPGERGRVFFLHTSLWGLPLNSAEAVEVFCSQSQCKHVQLCGSFSRKIFNTSGTTISQESVPSCCTSFCKCPCSAASL